jgi:DNA-binding MarR family transcriptional regulator
VSAARPQPVLTPSQGDQCPFVIGDDGLARLEGPHADAWFGLQRAHRELMRTLEASLESGFGLSISALEVLGRLAGADQRRRRLSRLAGDVGLSLSRVSRIVDSLERRGLVARKPYPNDSRATDACLTEAGYALLLEAQGRHVADVQRVFFDRLTEDELETLGRAFAQLLAEAAPAPPPV